MSAAIQAPSMAADFEVYSHPQLVVSPQKRNPIRLHSQTCRFYMDKIESRQVLPRNISKQLDVAN